MEPSLDFGDQAGRSAGGGANDTMFYASCVTVAEPHSVDGLAAADARRYGRSGQDGADTAPPRGSVRSGVDPNGQEWATGMLHHYGYIRGTLGVDGDHFDCFVGPNPVAPIVWIVTTMTPPAFREADEQKAMLGFNTEAEAREAFLAAYDDPRFLGAVVEMPLARFRETVMATREDPRFLKGGIALLFRAEGRE